jgi:hypothetical protein
MRIMIEFLLVLSSCTPLVPIYLDTTTMQTPPCFYVGGVRMGALIFRGSFQFHDIKMKKKTCSCQNLLPCKDPQHILFPNSHPSIIKWLTSNTHHLKACLPLVQGRKRVVVMRWSTLIFALAKVGACERSSQPIQRMARGGWHCLLIQQELCRQDTLTGGRATHGKHEEKLIYIDLRTCQSVLALPHCGATIAAKHLPTLSVCLHYSGQIVCISLFFGIWMIGSLNHKLCCKCTEKRFAKPNFTVI